MYFIGDVHFDNQFYIIDSFVSSGVCFVIAEIIEFSEYNVT